MFAPKLYIVRKLTLSDITENNFDVQTDRNTDGRYRIKQQDNQLFRQIRLITNDRRSFNKWIVFVDCSGGQNHKSQMERLIRNGFIFNSQHFVISERSASMVRTGILSFVDQRIQKEINDRVSMGLDIKKTVLSKYYAYRGLMLSSCHCFENWYPKIVIVPDYYVTVENQHIKYAYDKHTPFINHEGKEIDWVQKDIAEDYRDIEINAFDGCGIHHPLITQKIKELLINELSEESKINRDTISPTSVIWRAPYIKGVTSEMDYENFFEERGITSIKDIWGEEYSVTKGSEPLIIMCESMYKGYKYFNKFGDYRDWEEYWTQFKKYNHCIGIAKWNFNLDEEPVYTRGNYQILQDLNLDFDDFLYLARDSVEWIEKVINGDALYTYCFLGLLANNHNPSNNYARAILKNPEMLKEEGVRNYFISLVEKYRDEMKMGKLWLKSCFKFLCPDLIMLMEHIGGIENPQGCLEADEFFTFNKMESFEGEYLIERNPHICKSEHVILKATHNELLEKYCSHLVNVAMINCKSITPQRLNGADFDGDLVLVIDNKLMMQGVNRNEAITIDVEDKTTVLSEEDNYKNKLNVIMRGMHSLIGETSNCATAYHNKSPRTEEQKEKYNKYISLLSIINGKVIDSAKTGVIFNIPRNIAKYGKPLPYFMKYASEYYKSLHKFSKSNSNMNRLCWKLEKWDKTLRWKRKYKDFDYTIMLNNNIEVFKEDGIVSVGASIITVDEYENYIQQLEDLYLEFGKEMSQLALYQKEVRMYKEEDEEWLRQYISKKNAKYFTINWQHYYDTYKNKCREICPFPEIISNTAVRLCYEKYPNRKKNFLWRVAGDEVLNNIKQVDIFLPLRDDNGSEEYLGKKYSMVKVSANELNEEECC